MQKFCIEFLAKAYGDIIDIEANKIIRGLGEAFLSPDVFLANRGLITMNLIVKTAHRGEFQGRSLRAFFEVQASSLCRDRAARAQGWFCSGLKPDPVFFLENHEEPIEPWELIQKMLE